MTHLKRLSAPNTWNIHRKKNAWITTPNPGAHKLKNALPLRIVLRDMLKYASNSREVERILNSRSVLVNGRIETKSKAQAGLMDIIEIKKKNEHFLVSMDLLGRLRLEPVSKPKYRLCRIENKTVYKEGKLQLNLFSGVNVIAEKGKHAEYAVGDTLKLTLGENKIAGILERKKGAKALIIGGSHIGETAVINEVFSAKKPKEALLSQNGNEFRTSLSYVYVIE